MIAAMPDQSPLAALLCEINETVLGRMLTFESSTGSSLTVEVSGRRVLRVIAANSLSGAESCLAAEALEDEHKDSLIKLLQAVAEPQHELRVWALPTTREVDGVSVGLPVALLADLLLIDINPLEGVSPPDQRPIAFAPEAPAAPLESVSTPETEIEIEAETEAEAAADVQPIAPTVVQPVLAADEPGGAFLGTFAREVGPTLIAWLVVGGDDDGATDGPEEMVSHLQGFLADEAEALNQQLDAISTRPEDPVCIVLGAALVEGHSILCARLDVGLLLGLIEGDATQTMLRAWGHASRG